eukprot:PhM_4_TR14974/c0_g1_i1/m.16850
MFHHLRPSVLLYTILVTVTVSLFPNCVLAADAVDLFKAIGIPVFVLFTFCMGSFISMGIVLDVLRLSKQDRAHNLLVRSSLFTVVISVFLLFNSAWTYAVLNGAVGYVSLVVVHTPTMQRHQNWLVIVISVWLLVLVGIPRTLVGSGIVAVINECDEHFDTVKHTMCTSGYLMFLEIVGIVMICVNFFNFMLLFAAAVQGELKHSDGGQSTPLTGGVLMTTDDGHSDGGGRGPPVEP